MGHQHHHQHDRRHRHPRFIIISISISSIIFVISIIFFTVHECCCAGISIPNLLCTNQLLFGILSAISTTVEWHRLCSALSAVIIVMMVQVMVHSRGHQHKHHDHHQLAGCSALTGADLSYLGEGVANESLESMHSHRLFSTTAH